MTDADTPRDHQHADHDDRDRAERDHGGERREDRSPASGEPQPLHTEPGVTVWPSTPTPSPAGPPPLPVPSPPPQQQHRRPRRRRTRQFALLAAVALAAGGIGGGSVGLIGNAAKDTPSASTPVLGTSTSTKSSGTSVSDVAKAVSPSVVEITVRTRSGESTGSGIILDSTGKILTNNHVVADATDGNGTVTVTFSTGRTAKARVTGTDSDIDLALVKAEGVTGLKAATLGNSGEVALGDQVVAIGSPEGLTGTVTKGIVSALNREVKVSDGTQPQNPFGNPYDRTSAGTGGTTTYKAIQTDASLNPGNSGGPLIDMNGRVIGINSAMYSPTSGTGSGSGSVGLGFAIPINDAKRVIESMENDSTS